MKLIYNVKDKPKFGRLVVFAIQQMLAILAATIAVPAIVGNGMTAAAAMFGAGVGTIVYLLFTKFRSPVFLGSSFAFIGSMSAAFGGALSMQAGYAGLIIGAIFAGLVYVVIALIVKVAGVKWINAPRCHRTYRCDNRSFPCRKRYRRLDDERKRSNFALCLPYLRSRNLLRSRPLLDLRKENG